MQRKYLYASLAIAMLGAATILTWTLTRSHAGPGDVAANGDGKPAAPLPIAQVVLFNSGVGYIQREGQITGDARVELTFPTSDINDLLKSLVLEDSGGGKIGAISYDSQDPVDKILRSFALDLNNNPTYGQILNQARGEKIDVLRQEKPGANPFKVTGTIVGMESHAQLAGKDGGVEVEQLNLLTADGMLGIPLAQVLSVRFQNPALENDFRRALQVLAHAHDVQKKTVALQFTGKDKRPVRVGYVVERPIWKTTYRLMLEPGGKLYMQGWAIVENTSDDDWNNVRMVLVSGKPISYRMDLYEPLYIPRPLVEPELFASLRPPVYGGSFAGEEKRPPGDAKDQSSGGANPRSPMQDSQIAVNGGFGRAEMAKLQKLIDDWGMLPPGERDKAAQQIEETLKQLPPMHREAVRQYWQSGGQKKYQNPAYLRHGLSYPTQQKLAYDEFLARKQQTRAKLEQAKQKGSTIAGLNYKEGMQSVATAEEVGDYYQYIIDQKISLARQKSAMLPILNQTTEGSKVSIFNEAVHTKYPLLGIRLKNTSGKPLTQGPITVYDGGAYAGDTRTLDLQPNEERLLSYALDQATEVKTEVKTYPAPQMHFNIGGDNLTARYTLRQTTTYTLKNRGTHDRSVILEHGIRADWKLVDPKKPSDRSRDVYRFQVPVPAGATVKDEVVEEQDRTDPVALRGGGADGPPYYAVVSGIEVKPQVKTTPEQLVSLQIVKGVLLATYKQRESKTFFLQNQSEHDHTFTVDHVIRKEWKRLQQDGKDQVGPAVHRVEIAVKSKQTAHHEVVEERVFQDKSKVVAKLDDSVLRELIAHPAPAAKVKEALQQVLDKQAKLKTAVQDLADRKAAMKVLTEDQARMRQNLEIIPQSSEHYKDFLKKFVAQETQIEDAQRLIRTADSQVQKLQKDYEVYVNLLTAK
jgi:hypothetical protein